MFNDVTPCSLAPGPPSPPHIYEEMNPRPPRPPPILRGASTRQSESIDDEGHVTVQELMLENRRRRTRDFASRRRIGMRLRDNTGGDDVINDASTASLPPRAEAVAEEARPSPLPVDQDYATSTNNAAVAVRSSPPTEEERSMAAQAEVDQMVEAIKEIFSKDADNGDSDGSDDVELAMAKLLSLGLINSRPSTPPAVAVSQTEPSAALPDATPPLPCWKLADAEAHLIVGYALFSPQNKYVVLGTTARNSQGYGINNIG